MAEAKETLQLKRMWQKFFTGKQSVVILPNLSKISCESCSAQLSRRPPIKTRLPTVVFSSGDSAFFFQSPLDF
jgi:hypothetical protein